jgi:hypothetical protein
VLKELKLELEPELGVLLDNGVGAAVKTCPTNNAVKPLAVPVGTREGDRRPTYRADLNEGYSVARSERGVRV